jgi:predicted RNase H-like nuclease (RuvC/YqgF family)
MFLCRKVIRTLVVGGLGLGAAGGAFALIAGPERAAVYVSQVQERIQSQIDRNIDDPTALRAQLRRLEAEYPERIAQLAGDLAELNQQIEQLERDQAISERVVELASQDLGVLEEQLAQARPSGGSVALASSRVGGARDYAYEQALTRASQLRQTKLVYGARAEDAVRDLGYLQAQSTRIQDALSQLETERAQFQAQLWQIERQVDAIARNERLIEMMAERQESLDQHSRYEAASLEHLTGRLAQVRTRQEAELELLARDQEQVSYEELARIQLDGERRELAPAVRYQDGVDTLR